MPYRRKIHEAAKEKKRYIAEIRRLLELAEKIATSDPILAQKYVRYAVKIGTRTRIHMPREYRFHYCRKCYIWWIPASTVHIRVHTTHLSYTCANCQHQHKRWLSSLSHLPQKSFN